jgi:hypothetical protein
VHQVSNKRIQKIFDKIEGLQESFAEFEAEFPDEAAATAYALAWVVRVRQTICNICSTVNVPKEIHERKFPCLKCKKPVWITAGSMFEGVTYFRPWLAAFWFLERGIKINPWQFRELMGIHWFTADSIFKEVALSLLTLFQQGDSVTVPSSVFVSVYRRRSRETPAGEPPVAEETRARELAQKRSQSITRQQSPRPKSIVSHSELDIDENEKQIFDMISATPCSFDLLCERAALSVGELSAVLMSLELKGAVFRLPGNRYVRENLQSLVAAKLRHVDSTVSDKGTRATVKAFIKDILARHGGVSRKYVQLFVPLFVLLEHHKSWEKGTLLKLAINSKKIRYDDILDFVTDLEVAIFPRAPDNLVNASD